MSANGKALGDGGHWYKRDGSPCHTVLDAKGNERNTTLADARKLFLVPSVSAIVRVMARPSLEDWKRTQLAQAILTLPRIAGETEDAFLGRAEADAATQATKAKEKGQAIHRAIEEAIIAGKLPDKTAPHALAVECAITALHRIGGESSEWHTERSFACRAGYGGTTDVSTGDGSIMVDFKSTEFASGPKRKRLAYDEHAQQLAGYAQGLDLVTYHEHSARFPRMLNVFVSTSEPGLVEVVEWQRDELLRAAAMFNHCLGLWKLLQRFESGW